MTTRETLEAARATITDPDRWVQGQEVWQAKQGDPLKYCALGAVRRSIDIRECRYLMPRVVEMLAEVTPDPPECFNLNADGQKVAFFNDMHTHGEVLELFDRAIQRAQEREELRAGVEEDVSLSRAQVALGHIEGVAA